MPVVLDNDTGERVLLYGADGSTLRKIIVDSSGRLIVVGPGSGGAVTVTQTDPTLLKTAVHGIEGANQRQLLVDSTARLRLAAEAAANQVFVTQTTPASLTAAVHGIDGSTQRQLAVDASGRARVSEPEERTHTQVANSYTAGAVGPHANTSRFTYTVPAGRIARVQLLYALSLRDAAPGAAGQGFARFTFAPAGGGATLLMGALVQSITVGDQQSLAWGNDLWLFAGDVIDALTSDNSVGGSHFYNLGFKATEFIV